MKALIWISPLLLFSTVACDTLHENFSGACWTTEDSVTQTITMRCPDGSRATWDAPYGDGNCMISEDASGVTTIHCPDGTNAVLPEYVAEDGGGEGGVCTMTEGPAQESVLQCGAEQAVLSAGCGQGYPGGIVAPAISANPGEGGQGGGVAGADILYGAMDCDRILGVLHLEGELQMPPEHVLWDVRSLGGLEFGFVTISGQQSFRALESIQQLDVSWTSEIESVNFPALTEVGSFMASESLAPLHFPKVEKIGALWALAYDPGFDGVFPALTMIDELLVRGPEAASLLLNGFPALETVAEVLNLEGVEGQEAICAAEELIARLGAAGGLPDDVRPPEDSCVPPP